MILKEQGYIDAEGSFIIIIDRNKKRKLGWRVQSSFQIGLHIRDVDLIKEFSQYLGGIGSIHINLVKNKVRYSIDSSKDLIKLFKHFEKFPLLTQKAADSILFKQVVDLINNKEHLTLEGINKIVNIKASMNLGLSDMLKSEFQNNNSVKRPVINSDNIDIPNNWIGRIRSVRYRTAPDLHWVVSGEGCFDVRITKSTSHFTGYRVQLRLRARRGSILYYVKYDSYLNMKEIQI